MNCLKPIDMKKVVMWSPEDTERYEIYEQLHINCEIMSDSSRKFEIAEDLQ